MKRLALLTAAVVAAVAGFAALTVPPRHLALEPIADGTVAGILHVHTDRSDGRSGPDEIAAAAARAGLKFVVFTDHGDATRKPDPPTYRSGVLCLDGVEISTTGGHYVAIDMPAAPYPFAGEPRDVVDDVRRLGGFGIAAHPDSPKPDLRWRDWSAPFDGIELLNPDTSWRVWAQRPGWYPKRRLLTALVDFPFRPPETMASLIQDSGVLHNWQALIERRRLVSIAGIDAHARLAWRGDPGEERVVLPFPGYESSFRTLSVHVASDRRFSGDAANDAATLMRAIRNGNLYTAVDATATPPAFDFSATNALGTVHEGDELASGGPVTLHVRSNAPAEFTTIVYEGLRPVSSARDSRDLTVHASDRPAVYWVEIRSTGRPNPGSWIRSNPIYVRGTAPPPRPATRPLATTSRPIFAGTVLAGWRTEQDPTSLAAVDFPTETSELRFRYGLAGGSSVGQVAALVYDTPTGTGPYDRLTFTIRAERPMRISVQLRGGSGEVPGERWQRSVYIDTFDQERTVSFDDLTPVGVTASSKPVLTAVRSLLFVVDTTNTKPGASGRIWIRSAALER
jgi:hypothetical protein